MVAFFFPPVAQPGLTALSFVSSQIADAPTIVVPSAQAGDIGILIQATFQGVGTPTLVNPAGWAIGADVSVVSARLVVSSKVLVAADLGATLTGMNGDSSNSKTVLCIRPNGIVTSVSAISVNGEITNGNPTLQTITVAAQTTPTIVLGQGAALFEPSASGTLTSSGTLVNNTLQKVYYEIQNSSWANRTFDIGDTGNLNSLQSLALVVS